MNYIDMYCNFLQSVRWLSESSIAQHRRHVADFLVFFPKDLSLVGIADVYAYTGHVKDQERGNSSRYAYKWEGKLAYGTVRGKCVIIRQFLCRCKSYKLITFDPSHIQVPRNKPEKLESLTDREVALLIRAPRELHHRDDMYYRDTLLFMVWYYLGLRISEALVITFDDLDRDFLRIVGKGRKKRNLPIPFQVRDLAQEYRKMRWWIVQYEEQYLRRWEPRIRRRTVIDHNPHLVFTCLDSVKYGLPLTQDGVSPLFRKYEKYTWIQKRITFHMFRHSFATHLLQSWVDEFTVQQMMGHATILSTQSYITISDKQKANAQDRLWSWMRIVRESFSQVQWSE